MDTGAMMTTMPAHFLKSMGLSKTDLRPTSTTMKSASGTDMRVLGKLRIKATCNNITYTTSIVVTELGEELLLGIRFALQFKLVELADACKVRSIKTTASAVHTTEETEVDYKTLTQKWKKHLPLGKNTGDPLSDLKNIFPDMFDGSVGLFDGETELKVTPDAQPIQLPPRAVPLSTLPKLKKELDDMEKQGIIRPCPETTDWVHNLVIVAKKNGKIRVCLDPRNLNKGLIRNVHYTASWEDAQSTFRTGKYFSTLDAKSGYWTQKLSPKSQLLTAFNTPFKKYCFIRLPFGLSVSAEIF